MNRNVKEALLFNNQDSMQYLSKVIAMYIRKELIGKYNLGANIEEGPMADINRNINDGIYNALYILSNSFNDPDCFMHLVETQSQIPDSWENPVLDKSLRSNLIEKDTENIKFTSIFLNQQLESGNIYKVPGTLFIRCKNETEWEPQTSFDFKKNLKKIYSNLKKEGYTYDACRDAYVKLIITDDVLPAKK